MDSFPINAVDLGIFAVLVLSGLLAFLRGFVAEIFSIAAWVGALAVSVYGYKPAVPFVTDLTGLDGTIADLVAGAVLFVVSLIVFMILARLAGGRCNWPVWAPSTGRSDSCSASCGAPSWSVSRTCWCSGPSPTARIIRPG